MIRMGVPTQVDSGRAGGCKFLGSGLWGEEVDWWMAIGIDKGRV